MPTDLIVWAAYIFFLYFVVYWLIVYLDTDTKEIIKTRKEKQFLSIAIPAYNEEDSIEKTIESVLKLKYPRERYEIIVVNDGSRDRTKVVVEDIIERNKEHNLILINQENQGKGAALNNALRRARGEFFITLDADSFVKENAVDKLLGFFDREDMAAVLPVIKVASEKGFWAKLQYCEYLINFYMKKIYGSLDCIHVTPGPFSVYKTNIIRKLGGFDENNLTEDQEMAMRLQKYHYKIKQIWSTDVLTVTPKNFKEFYKQRNRWYKGTVFNLIKYKDILFNKKYGEYGVFFLPSILMVAAISMLYSFYMLYNYIVEPILSKLYTYSFINYDISLMTETYFRRFSPLDFNYPFLFFGATVILLTITWIILAHKHINENLFRKNALISSVLYMTVYPPIIAIAWFGVFLDLVRRKKQKW